MRSFPIRSFSMILLLSAFSFAADETGSSFPLEKAQEAYVSGNWKAAAEGFESVCPSLNPEKRSECALWGVLARSQTGNSKDFSQAGKRLDSLIVATPDSLPVFSDLYMTRAQFELYLKRNDLAFKSLRTAFAKARQNQIAVLHQVCQSLYKADPSDSVQALCTRIESARTASSAPGPGSPAKSTKPAEAIDSATTEQPSSQATASSSSSEVPKTVSSSAGSSANAEPWALQLGAFSLEANAETLAKSLNSAKIEARIVKFPKNGRTLYLVQTGSFESREAAMDYGHRRLEPRKLEFQPVKKP